MKITITKWIILITWIASMFNNSNGQENKIYNYLIGTYTDNNNQGINHIVFNSFTNSFTIKEVIANIKNPSFVIANKSKTIVVAVEETADSNGGKVTSYRYEKLNNSFTKINSVFTGGDHPCAVTFSPNEKYVIVGNYTGGNLAAIAINTSGELSNNIQLIQHKGNSINTARQEKPHVHDVVFHPTENKLFIADLGNDTIEIIPYLPNKIPSLNDNNAKTIKVNPGSGPRHLLFNQTGNILYVICELSNQIMVYHYNKGNLTLFNSVDLTNPTSSGTAAELRLSKNGNFLYASVRGNDNAIVVLKSNPDGTLSKIQTIATGKTPRCFILSPDETKVLVANQDSNTITVFNRDTTTGILTQTESSININKPVYLYPF